MSGRRLVVLTLFVLATATPSYALTLVFPTVGKISSGFGIRIHPIYNRSEVHSGVDIAAPLGSPIRAVGAGMVIFSGPLAGYGNLVVVQHGRGLSTHYGHCQNISVSLGQRVAAGQVLAEVGSTGISTGPHLHFELRIAGKAYDPRYYMPGLLREAKG